MTDLMACLENRRGDRAVMTIKMHNPAKMLSMDAKNRGDASGCAQSITRPKKETEITLTIIQAAALRLNVPLLLAYVLLMKIILLIHVQWNFICTGKLYRICLI